ncbi:15105_t:CDS:2, partial [Dentiscutata erythropus]
EQIQELEVQMEGLKFENSNLANQLENESIWKYSLQQMPDHICPIQMTVKQYCRLKFDKTCQFCGQPNNNCTILELKIRICRQCRELELTSYSSELIPALYLVDYEQLNGNYLDYSVRELKAVSYVIFYLKIEVTKTYEEYYRVSYNKKQEWLNNRTNVVQEYYNDILKIKHPSITNQYLISAPQTSDSLTRQNSFLIPNIIIFNISFEIT